MRRSAHALKHPIKSLFPHEQITQNLRQLLFPYLSNIDIQENPQPNIGVLI
jgi:hypothetical protein